MVGRTCWWRNSLFPFLAREGAEANEPISAFWLRQVTSHVQGAITRLLWLSIPIGVYTLWSAPSQPKRYYPNWVYNRTRNQNIYMSSVIPCSSACTMLSAAEQGILFAGCISSIKFLPVRKSWWRCKLTSSFERALLTTELPSARTRVAQIDWWSDHCSADSWMMIRLHWPHSTIRLRWKRASEEPKGIAKQNALKGQSTQLGLSIF